MRPKHHFALTLELLPVGYVEGHVVWKLDWTLHWGQIVRDDLPE